VCTHDNLLGHNYTTPDPIAKVKGTAAPVMPEVPVPDPETPVGVRGVGDDVYRPIPFTPDVVPASLDLGRSVHDVRTACVYAT
jgi:hypothetical protein